MNIRVRLLKDWNFQRQGEIAEVYEPTARNWILNGIAEEITDSRSLPVERSVAVEPAAVERAVRKPSASGRKS
jgi:hypothetical protein